jgi:hypothetical protein
MVTRKIIDAKQNGEKVWLKGHAKAVYMSDGSTVEDAINNINQSGGTDNVDWENIQNKPDITHDEYSITIGKYSESLEMSPSIEIGGGIFVSDNGNEVSIGKGDGSGYVYLPKNIQINDYNYPYIDGYGINIHPDKITISYDDYSSGKHDFKDDIIYTRLGDGSKFLSNDGTYKIIRKEIVRFDNNSIVLKPNKYYILTATYPSLTITLDENGTSGEDANYVNEYCIQIPISATTTSVALPNNIKWANGEIPTFENGCTYQISIINGFGICTKFK